MRDDADTPIPLSLQTGKDLLPNHIDLPLIQVTAIQTQLGQDLEVATVHKFRDWEKNTLPML